MNGTEWLESLPRFLSLAGVILSVFLGVASGVVAAKEKSPFRRRQLLVLSGMALYNAVYVGLVAIGIFRSPLTWLLPLPIIIVFVLSARQHLTKKQRR